MKTKSYLEIKVPISFDVPWFCELREALKDIPVRWQRNYYHITMAFIYDTQHLPEVEAIMHKYLDNARPVTITFDTLDIFSTDTGMFNLNLTTSDLLDEFQRLVDDIRFDICCTNSDMQSDFRLHVTLGRITEPKNYIEEVGFLIDEIELKPFTLTLNEVEYRLFRGRSIYKNLLR